jgi:CheY-like chemotaxis protein
MPGMSGFEVLETLRRRGSDLPVIIVTGQPSKAAEQRAKAAGVLAVVSKPYRADELLALIRNASDGLAPESPKHQP